MPREVDFQEKNKTGNQKPRPKYGSKDYEQRYQNFECRHYGELGHLARDCEKKLPADAKVAQGKGKVNMGRKGKPPKENEDFAVEEEFNFNGGFMGSSYSEFKLDIEVKISNGIWSEDYIIDNTIEGVEAGYQESENFFINGRLS